MALHTCPRARCEDSEPKHNPIRGEKGGEEPSDPEGPHRFPQRFLDGPGGLLYGQEKLSLHPI
ncbi:hypothetical protein HS1genome_1736 [Sulfodiicoccus acidiphilus]|uniref:Uncharacterized protein n=1 Tax=Sulfodiicoccus acidiphilus TaxID=1670455 RepID=A0A348B595_9CREN|nr:hypothetical protein HS1genome_1736 [Sulfodiicoccus acidiphilus]GGT88932.1 hypothetical protein GCM10007116_03440 [Sulfodiicoccus acidiphilus]